eukprot:TRINITY_DN39925_c0_g1_i1.p1 TRINITY_DN39925_c0_g1~~TRINITY_DN39925_c0_g1_i1.p1  ORF type:complete len:111 (+),score=4.88 TRINITY_DN39925_c0_g1_i1:1695-2027(+)
MLSEFHYRGRISREMNSNFLTLIPQVPNPVDLGDYKPISVMGCLYKLAKTLANQLKQVLHPIISLYQVAFMARRQILDRVLNANEIIHSRKWSKEEIPWAKLGGRYPELF